uniref:Eukaryotic translation initiation factor isoform 4G-2 n=1 Tax=Noccaea caerulescens TaxID=107243 RepID=A0A1J3JY63_NOCCA
MESLGHMTNQRGDGGERLRFSGEQLLKLKQSLKVCDEILRRSKEIAAEIFGEEQSWVGLAVKSKVSVQFERERHPLPSLIHRYCKRQCIVKDCVSGFL